jgi:nucleotide-binding universal stress UspA family protein
VIIATRMLAICEIDAPCDDIVVQSISLARALRAKLFLMTVLDDPFGTKGLSFPRPSLSRDYDRLLEKTEKELQAFGRIARQQAVPVQIVIREGETVAEISNAIEEENIDLLVLPAYARTRLEQLFSGKVNRTFLRLMPCSVLFVKNEPKALPEEAGQPEEAAVG